MKKQLDTASWKGFSQQRTHTRWDRAALPGTNPKWPWFYSGREKRECHKREAKQTLWGWQTRRSEEYPRLCLEANFSFMPQRKGHQPRGLSSQCSESVQTWTSAGRRPGSPADEPVRCYWWWSPSLRQISTSHEREGEPLGNEGFLTGPHVVGLLLALAFCNQYLWLRLSKQWLQKEEND